jgi:hypothetical protein
MIIYNPQTNNPNDLMSPIKSTNIMMMMMMKGVKKALLFHALLLKNMVFPKKPWIMTYV